MLHALGLADDDDLAGAWPTSCSPPRATTAAGESGTRGPADLSTTVEALLRAAAVRGTGGRPAHGGGAGGGPRPRRREPGALLHEAVAGGARPLPVGRHPGAAARDDAAAAARATVAVAVRLLGPRHVRRPDGRAVAPPRVPASRRRGRALRGGAGGGPAAGAADAGTVDAVPHLDDARRPRLQPPADPGAAPGVGGPRSPGGSASARRPTARGAASSRPWVYSIIALHSLGLPARPPRDPDGRSTASTTPSRCTSTATACASRRACRPSGTRPSRRSPWRTPAPATATPTWRRPATGCSRRRSPGSATGAPSPAGGGPAAGRSSSPTSGTPTPTTPPRC